MKEIDETYYLFTLVNLSEDLEVNGEHENQLFKAREKAIECMEEAISVEISAYSENHGEVTDIYIERIADDMVNLWLNDEKTEAVLYRVINIKPI